MPFDVDRYRSLISRAAFDCSFYKGTIQDLSPAQRAMSFVGAPTWGQVNGVPCLQMNGAVRVSTSAAVPRVVDTTNTFWVELLGSHSTTDYLMYQISGGGWTVYYISATNQIVLGTYTAATANARNVNMAAMPLPGRLFHIVGYLDPVGLGGQWWVSGMPVATVFANTGVPANCANAIFQLANVGPAIGRGMINRVWSGTPANEDVSALYGAAHVLTGGEV